jgi:hypothetical protein
MAYLAIKNELAGRAFKAFKRNLTNKRMKKLSITVRKNNLMIKATQSLQSRVHRRHLSHKRQQIIAMKDNMGRLTNFMAFWKQRYNKKVFLREALQSFLNKKLLAIYSVLRDNSNKQRAKKQNVAYLKKQL